MRVEIENFLEHLAFSKKRSSRTCVIYTQVLRDFEKFLAGAELSEENARGYLRSRATGISSNTQALTVSILRSLARWLKTEGRGRAWNLRSPKQVQKKIRVFAEEDLSILVATVEKRPLEEQILFHLLYGSALRISEVLTLRWEHIALAKAKARVLGKGSRWREVPLTSKAVILLGGLKPGADTWHDGLLNYAQAHKWVASWGEESGIAKKYGALHPHLLRHALASHLLRRGGKLPHIQKLLGHRHLSTTEKYTHLEVDDLLRAYDKAIPKKLAA